MGTCVRIALLLTVGSMLALFQNCGGSFTVEREGTEKISASLSFLQQERLAVQNAQNHFYVGYFFSAANNDEYVQTLSAMNDHTNSSWVQAKWSHPDTLWDVIDKIKESRKNGQKSFIHLQPYFFEYNGAEMTSKLRADYKVQWTRLVEHLTPYTDDIAGFLIFDEPVANNDLVVNPIHRLSHQIIYENLSLVNEVVKKSYPYKPTVLIFGAPEVHAGMLVPPVDWVGLDCYGDTNNCSDAVSRSMSIRAWYDILKSRMLSHQKLIAFPQTFAWRKPGHSWNMSDAQVAQNLDYYEQMVNEDPRFVGFFPYLWQDSSIQNYPVLGASSLPLTLKKAREISSRLLQKKVDRIPTGYIDDISGNGLVSGWALDPDAPESSIAVQFYLDGPFDSGIWIGETRADKVRADVNSVLQVSGDHGFSFNLPTSLRDGKVHTVYAYAMNSDAKGEPRLLNLMSFTLAAPIVTPTPAPVVPTASPPPQPAATPAPAGPDKVTVGYLDQITSSGLVTGWAYDPDTPSQSIFVHAYIDGTYLTGTWVLLALANQARPDVNKEIGIQGQHGFSFQLPAWYRDGKPHTLFVYGINSNSSGQNVLLNYSPKSFTWK